MKLLKIMLLNVLVLNLGLPSIQAMDDVGSGSGRDSGNDSDDDWVAEEPFVQRPQPSNGYQKLAMTALLLAAADLAARRGDSLPARGAKNLQKLGSWLWNGSEKGRWADALTHLKRNKGKYITAALAALVAIGTKRGRRAVQLARGWSDARAPWHRALLNPLEAARFGFTARKHGNLDTCWLDTKPGFARGPRGVFAWLSDDVAAAAQAPALVGTQAATSITNPFDLLDLPDGTEVSIKGQLYKVQRWLSSGTNVVLEKVGDGFFMVDCINRTWYRWNADTSTHVLHELANPFPFRSVQEDVVVSNSAALSGLTPGAWVSINGKRYCVMGLDHPAMCVLSGLADGGLYRVSIASALWQRWDQASRSYIRDESTNPFVVGRPRLEQVQRPMLSGFKRFFDADGNPILREEIAIDGRVFVVLGKEPDVANWLLFGAADRVPLYAVNTTDGRVDKMEDGNWYPHGTMSGEPLCFIRNAE